MPESENTGGLAMSQTTTPDGPGHRDDAAIRHDRASEPRRAAGSDPHGTRRSPVVSFVTGSMLCVLALVLLAGGAVGLWKDRVDRDSQDFVTLGTTELKTDQYAIVGDLQGDGPDWLYGSTVLGGTRVRATSQADQPLFIGIARTDDVLRYLRGAGYATVYGFEVSDDTTQPGEAPSTPPSSESIWAASTQGSGRQTLRWMPRDGEWSVAFMNADAGANVDVRGDASANLPALPWIAGGLLILGAVCGLIGTWVLLRALRRGSRSPRSAANASGQEVAPGETFPIRQTPAPHPPVVDGSGAGRGQ
jgi:hypothetical protein